MWLGHWTLTLFSLCVFQILTPKEICRILGYFPEHLSSLLFPDNKIVVIHGKILLKERERERVSVWSLLLCWSLILPSTGLSIMLWSLSRSVGELSRGRSCVRWHCSPGFFLWCKGTGSTGCSYDHDLQGRHLGWKALVVCWVCYSGGAPTGITSLKIIHSKWRVICYVRRSHTLSILSIL